MVRKCLNSKSLHQFTIGFTAVAKEMWQGAVENVAIGKVARNAVDLQYGYLIFRRKLH